MATRDRTALFLRYREEASALHGSRSTLRSRLQPSAKPPHELSKFSSGVGNVVKRGRTESRDPRWLFVYKDLVGDMAEIDKTLFRLSALYAKHLLPSFSDGDHVSLEADLGVLAGELTQMLHGAEAKIRNIGSTLDTEDDALVRRNVQKRFATQLQDFSMTFRRKQKDYLAELRGQREAMEADIATGVDTEANGAKQLGSVGAGDACGLGGAFSDASLLPRDKLSSIEAEERAQEISKIAANINDLASIVKDLATLVVDQGTVLDRVDYNVEEVRTTTKHAVRELRIADRYQRKGHAFWCIVFLAIGCGVLVCLLLLKWLQ
jgi:syntaxin 16